MRRPAISAPEPAVSGTISRIARVGYSCAPAQVDMAAASRHCHAYFVTCMTTRGRPGGGSAMKQIVVALVLLISSDAARAEFNVVEASIADMQQAMASGRVTSRELVQQYLMRIALYDKKLNAVITVNPNALREAEERDRERTQGRLIGPLHGIPIALKDNIHTTNMPTTGGALAFDGFVPPYE